VRVCVFKYVCGVSAGGVILWLNTANCTSSRQLQKCTNHGDLSLPPLPGNTEIKQTHNESLLTQLKWIK